MKVLSPVIINVTFDQGFHLPEVSTDIYEQGYVFFLTFSTAQIKPGEYIQRCRGLSPQRVDELTVLELGRTLLFLNAAIQVEETR